MPATREAGVEYTAPDLPPRAAPGGSAVRAVSRIFRTAVAEITMVQITRPTLFAHLATRFGAQPELLATEALAFLLASSAAVRQAVLDVCTIAAPRIAGVSGKLQFHTEQRTQAAGDEQLVGVDTLGVTRIVVNPRFWSSLPDDQPARSLRQLTPGHETVLLVLAPAERFTS
ncbi:MAG: hypothetical protein AB7P40_20780, partial [Chloroflexota bacterium]